MPDRQYHHLHKPASDISIKHYHNTGDIHQRDANKTGQTLGRAVAKVLKPSWQHYDTKHYNTKHDQQYQIHWIKTMWHPVPTTYQTNPGMPEIQHRTSYTRQKANDTVGEDVELPSHVYAWAGIMNVYGSKASRNYPSNLWMSVLIVVFESEMVRKMRRMELTEDELGRRGEVSFPEARRVDHGPELPNMWRIQTWWCLQWLVLESHWGCEVAESDQLSGRGCTGHSMLLRIVPYSYSHTQAARYDE